MHALMPLAALALAAALVGCEYAGGPNVPVPVPSAGVGTAGIIAAGGDVTGSGGGNIIAAGGGNVVGHNGAAAVPVLERTRAPRAPAPAASEGPTPAPTPGQPGPLQRPSCDAGFEQADADHDGAITVKELGSWQQGEAWRQEVACPPATPCDAPTLGARLTTYDANADGSLDQGELCELLDAAFGAAGASAQAGPAT